jgi:hypothetical protein
MNANTLPYGPEYLHACLSFVSYIYRVASARKKIN